MLRYTKRRYRRYVKPILIFRRKTRLLTNLFSFYFVNKEVLKKKKKIEQAFDKCSINISVRFFYIFLNNLNEAC